jgi:SAM-dependent methyltransferase
MKINDIEESSNLKYCPICNQKSTVFNSFGVIKRNNAECPSCGSLERHRLLWLYIESKKYIKENIKILHVAPEKCLHDKLMASQFGSYISRKNVDINFDLTTNPFNENVFDLIICNHVLEHVKDDIRAMKELHRVLKPNGVAFLMVPLFADLEKTIEEPPNKQYSPGERLKYFGQRDHVRKYGRDYKSRLVSVGFDVSEIDYASEFSVKEKIMLSIIPFDLIHECRKAPLSSLSKPESVSPSPALRVSPF